jgi:polyketide synthase PksL
LCQWPEGPAVVAINCFADGGTNAHVIVEAWQGGDGVGVGVLGRAPLPAPHLYLQNLRKEEANGFGGDEGNDPPSIWETFN